MVKTTVYIQQYQQDELKKIATERITYSEHIRRAIDLYLMIEALDLDDDMDTETEVE